MVANSPSRSPASAFVAPLPLARATRSGTRQSLCASPSPSPRAARESRAAASALRATAADRAAQAAAASSQSASRLADTLDSVPSQLRTSLLRLPQDADIAPLGTRLTKIVATVGPSTCSRDNLLRLIAAGVNVIRLNLSHGDFDWHRQVIREVREINISTPFISAILVDVGSYDTVRLGEFSSNPILNKGDQFTLTVRHEAEYPAGVSEVSDDAFIAYVEEGDLLQCQGEVGTVVELLVKKVDDTDAVCEVVSAGELRSRGNITVRGKSLNLAPHLQNEDINSSIARTVLGCPPHHLEFALEQRVEYIALSFVESPAQIQAVKQLLSTRGENIGIIAKIESQTALNELEPIVAAADAVMIARGDLGTSVSYEKVPFWQETISKVCVNYGKPCLISTHFLESMVLYPTPTRAEVTDMTEAVKQKADALVLTAETASGKFPFKAVSTMHSVLLSMQRRVHEMQPNAISKEIPPLVKDTTWWTAGVGDIAENIARSAADLSNEQRAKAILVFTQKGLMATLTSRCRPKAPIYAFTATPVVRNKMTLLYGVRPFRVRFEDDPEGTITNAMAILKERSAVSEGDLVIVLADVLGGRQGAAEEEMQSAFTDMAKGKKYITASEVRSALRVLGMKVSDKLEAQLGMRDVDLEEADREIKMKNEEPVGEVADEAVGRYDFNRFKEFALLAKEIVHTLQLRIVA